jgi:hypothetical protein
MKSLVDYLLFELILNAIETCYPWQAKPCGSPSYRFQPVSRVGLKVYMGMNEMASPTVFEPVMGLRQV